MNFVYKKLENVTPYDLDYDLVESDCLNDIFDLKDKIEGIQNWNQIRFITGDYEFLTRGKKDIINRAYFKMWEMIDRFHLNIFQRTPLNMACICEAPGGFIQALIRYRENKRLLTREDRVTAISLKDSSDKTEHDISWDKKNKDFDKVNIKLYYGEDPNDNGDLLNPKIVDDYIRLFDDDKADLVTADGGFHVPIEYENYKEIAHSKLFFSEIYVAISVLRKGGCFVLKIYDMTTKITAQLMDILCLSFRVVDIFKPRTSRMGNSERYLICSDFKGLGEDYKKMLGELLISNYKTDELLVNIHDNTMNPRLYKQIKDANGYIMTNQRRKLTEMVELGDESVDEIQKYKSHKISVKKRTMMGWMREFRHPFLHRH